MKQTYLGRKKKVNSTELEVQHRLNRLRQDLENKTRRLRGGTPAEQDLFKFGRPVSPKVFIESREYFGNSITNEIYPWIIDDKDAVSLNGRFKEFVNCLKNHFTTVLKSGCCIDKDSGGWKLSSTSKNTWLSKIFLNQFIAKNILNSNSDSWDKWDKVHASWQINACKLWAATDQVESDTGADLGSRLYPRLVTSFLWLNKWK